MKRKGHASGRVIGTLTEMPPLDYKSGGSWPFLRERIAGFMFDGTYTRGVNCDLLNFTLADGEYEYKFVGRIEEFDTECGAYRCSVESDYTTTITVI